MKKFICLIVCLLSVSFCFAQKKEFFSNDYSRCGSVELASEGNLHIVNFSDMMLVQHPRANYLICSFLLMFDTYEDAEKFYRAVIKNIGSYQDFISVNDIVAKNPKVSKVDANNFIDNGVIYSIKNVEVGKGEVLLESIK